MLTIDGSYGEGGGQILRSALGLSILTGRPFRIEKIRAGRRRPGLMRQHLTAVRAAREICDATLEGDALSSQELTFSPGKVRGGDYRFAIGTAGSTMLVLQTLLIPLLHADQPSTLRLEGGTHAKSAPPFEFAAQSLVPLLEKMGARVSLSLERYGFYPAGGGEVFVEISPLQGTLSRLELVERRRDLEASLQIITANLPDHIARREIDAFIECTGWQDLKSEVVDTNRAHCAGNMMLASLKLDDHIEVFSEVGEKGRAAEDVAESCGLQVLRFLERRAAVGPHLCDQLLLPLALGKGGRIRTSELTGHSRTQLWLIPQFVDVQIDVVRLEEDMVEVEIEPR